MLLGIFTTIIPSRESDSLKKVFPALCGRDYSGLDIDNGALASAEFFEMCYGDGANRERIRENLLKYCELDTFAEVSIVERLREIVS